MPIQAVTEEEIASQPPPFQEMRVHNSEVDHDSVMHLLDPTPQQRHRQRAYYMANVSMIDDKVGELLAALEDQGYLENAVVIFTPRTTATAWATMATARSGRCTI